MTKKCNFDERKRVAFAKVSLRIYTRTIRKEINDAHAKRKGNVIFVPRQL